MKYCRAYVEENIVYLSSSQLPVLAAFLSFYFYYQRIRKTQLVQVYFRVPFLLEFPRLPLTVNIYESDLQGNLFTTDLCPYHTCQHASLKTTL